MKNKGYAFIPCFIFSNLFLAVAAPYLSILIRDLGYTPFWIGLLLSIFESASLAGPFILGYLADKKGNYRLPLIIACILPVIVVFPLITWVHPVLSAIFLFFIAFGIRSLYSLIDAITTVNIGIDGNYGKIRVWGSITFIVMTMFLQWVPFLKPENALNISLWIFITAFLCFIPILVLPKALLTAHHEVAQPNELTFVQKQKRKSSFGISFYAFTGFSVIFLSRFGLAAVVSYFSLYMIEIVNWDAVGLMWALGAFAEVPFIFLSRALIKRFGSMTLMGISAIGVCARLLILAFLPLKPWIVFACFLHSICFGIYHPAAINFVTSLFPSHKRARGMSLLMIMGTGLPVITGTLAGGAIIQAFGYRPLFISYACVSGLAVIIYLIYLFLSKEKSHL